MPNVALSIDSDTPPFDDSFYDAVISELYGNGGYTPDYLTTPNGSALIGETNRVLMEGVSKGVSSVTEEPDPAFSSALAQNTFIFSGFKTHQELQEVNSLLHDKDGNLRPFDEFKRDVDKLGKQYNQNYLQAEYNHAVQSAQMAAKWQEFQKHKDFVNLQYRTANDERVRAEHAALHGTTLPVDDKFWTKYLPPLGWNCRCTVVEVLKDSYPESNSDEATRAADSATSLPSQKIFRFNPGKELKVFPPKHPYLPKGCGNCKRGVGAKNLAWSPDNPDCQACRNIAKCEKKLPSDTPKVFRKNILEYGKKHIIGKIEYHSSVFEGTNKAIFVKNSITENTRYGELMFVKIDILNNIEEYLKNLEVQKTDVYKSHNDDKYSNYYYGSLIYHGSEKEFEGREVEFYFCQLKNGSEIHFHFIKIK